MNPSATYRLPYIVVRPAKLDSLRESASDTQLGVAIRLVHYCIVSGYAGRIPAARDWTARQWLYNSGVDTPPATDVAQLWHWEADALIVDLYDHEYAQKCIARSSQSSTAAHARWNADSSGSKCGRISTPHADALITYNNKPNTNTVHLSSNLEREGLHNAELSYAEWKAVMKKCHPSCAKVSATYFAGDVENAALEAYHQYPDAPQYAELLTAFYTNTKIKERKTGIAFYRPTAQHLFFRNLGDIITHAQDWAKETRWKPTSTQNKTTQNHETELTQNNKDIHPSDQQNQPAMDTDTDSFSQWLNTDRAAHTTAGSKPKANTEPTANHHHSSRGLDR